MMWLCVIAVMTMYGEQVSEQTVWRPSECYYLLRIQAALSGSPARIVYLGPE